MILQPFADHLHRHAVARHAHLDQRLADGGVRLAVLRVVIHAGRSAVIEMHAARTLDVQEEHGDGIVGIEKDFGLLQSLRIDLRPLGTFHQPVALDAAGEVTAGKIVEKIAGIDGDEIVRRAIDRCSVRAMLHTAGGDLCFVIARERPAWIVAFADGNGPRPAFKKFARLRRAHVARRDLAAGRHPVSDIARITDAAHRIRRLLFRERLAGAREGCERRARIGYAPTRKIGEGHRRQPQRRHEK